MVSVRGFTLIELVVTVAVAAILGTIAIPSFETTIENNREVAQTNALLEALDLARSSAIKGGGNWTATVCAGATTACSGTNWSNGWVVFTTDPNNNMVIVRTFPALSGGNTLTSSGGYSYTFNSSGMLNNVATDFYFVLCDTRGATWARSVSLLMTGTAETAQTPGYQVGGTTPLTCPGP